MKETRRKLPMKLSACQFISVIRKEFLINCRQRAIFVSMLMFSLTALACISLAIGGTFLESKLLSALLWIIIFFASTALDKTFDDEAITTLKIYGDSQSIFFGKMIFSLISMTALMIFLLPTFLILFDCEVKSPPILLITIFFGICGISGAGTLISAISATASIRSGLFSILLFPIILPIFLLAIDLTSAALLNFEIPISSLITMIIYDSILILAGSILFDYLWY